MSLLLRMFMGGGNRKPSDNTYARVLPITELFTEKKIISFTFTFLGNETVIYLIVFLHKHSSQSLFVRKCGEQLIRFVKVLVYTKNLVVSIEFWF